MVGDTQRIENGWDVYGSDGEKVGNVAEVGSNYLLVQKGLFFTKDFYIPTSAVASVRQDEVRLSLASGEIEHQGWDSPPQSTSHGVSAGAMSGTVATGNVDSGRSRQSDEVAIPVVEENISVGRREVDSGGVRVTQRVEEQPVREQVTLRDETIEVERVPVDRPVDPDTVRDLDEAFIPVSVEMRERDEVPVVDKQARVVEEVVVDKEVRERTETVEGTVRRTDVDVHEVGGETRR